MALAGAGLVGFSPAKADVPQVSGPGAFVEARAAEMRGDGPRASRSFAAALAADPANQLVGRHALRHATWQGDWPLALQAARSLEASEALPADGRFPLVADAVRRGDWAAAEAQLAKIAADAGPLASLAPIIQAWMAFGRSSGDPLAPLNGTLAGLAPLYVDEHRQLLALAAGRDASAQELAATAGRQGVHGLRLRIAAAALLSQRGKRAEALALLEGDGTPLRIARAAIEAGRPLPGAIADPAAGIAELFVRLALDLNAQRVTEPAIGFARLASFLDPASSEARLVLAELLAGDDRPDLAAQVLEDVAADDPFLPNARDLRIRLLAQQGREAEALAEAQRLAALPGAGGADWARVGQLLSGADRYGEAAAAFERALAARTADEGGPEWALWMLRGAALDQAGEWPAAREALRTAYRLAPSEPLVLNYLGYAQLVRRENMDEAERLIREAHRLAPDNGAITDSLGWALFLRGKIIEAIALLEQAAQAEPSDTEINEHLGDAYWAAGRRADARYAWRAAAVHADRADAERLRAKIERGWSRALAAR